MGYRFKRNGTKNQTVFKLVRMCNWHF